MEIKSHLKEEQVRVFALPGNKIYSYEEKTIRIV